MTMKTGKSEIRNPKEVANSKQQAASERFVCFFLFWDFEFPSDFGFRISDFYIQEASL